MLSHASLRHVKPPTTTFQTAAHVASQNSLTDTEIKHELTDSRDWLVSIDRGESVTPSLPP